MIRLDEFCRGKSTIAYYVEKSLITFLSKNFLLLADEMTQQQEGKNVFAFPTVGPIELVPGTRYSYTRYYQDYTRYGSSYVVAVTTGGQ